MLVTVPLIMIANIIPITVSGLGIRETFALEVLGNFGIEPELAVGTSLTVFFINTVLPALIGLYFLVTKKISKNNMPNNN